MTPTEQQNDGCTGSREWIPASRYTPPERPTPSSLRRAFERLRDAFAGDDDAEIATHRLKATDAQRRDRLSPGDAAGPWRTAFAASLSTMGEGVHDPPRHRIFLVPTGSPGSLFGDPTDPAGPLRLPAPPRHALGERARIGVESDIEFPPDDGRLLLIDDIARWCLRHQDAVKVVRRLLERVAERRSPVAIGCNPFAWTWIGRALGAERFLPEPMLPAPCQARDLARWFAGVESDEQVCFRDARSGEDVLATDADGEPHDGFLAELAARSLGVPWLAWHLWRAAMRDTSEDESASGADTDAPDNERTIWLAHRQTDPLPERDRRDARLVVHGVLLHERIDADTLASTLPLAHPGVMVMALLERGLLLADDAGQLSVSPTEYPTMRAELQSAGISCGPC